MVFRYGFVCNYFMKIYFMNYNDEELVGEIGGWRGTKRVHTVFIG